MIRRIVPEPVNFGSVLDFDAKQGFPEQGLWSSEPSNVHYCAPTAEVLRRFHPPSPAPEAAQAINKPRPRGAHLSGRHRKQGRSQLRNRAYDLAPKEARAYERVALMMQRQREAAIAIQRAWRAAQSRKLIRVFAGRQEFTDFKSQLAYRLREYQQRRRLRRIMVEWCVYARRLHALRNQLMAFGRRRRLLRMGFQGWREGAKFAGIIRRGLQHLYIYHTAPVWQHMLIWLKEAKKLHLMRTHFFKVRDFARRSKWLKAKWLRWAAYYELHRAASRIQAGCRGHLARCKIRRISKLSLLVFGHKRAFRVIRQRKKLEQKRFAKEERIIRPIVSLAESVLSEYLRSEEGSCKLQELRIAVQTERDRRRRAWLSAWGTWLRCRGRIAPYPDEATVAPAETPLENLSLYHRRSFVMSINKHTADVLSLRCRTSAMHLARRHYRRSNPPVHECMRCDEVFALRALRDFHLRQQPNESYKHCACSYNQEYSSVTWHYAKEIVDTVMDVVVGMYYEQQRQDQPHPAPPSKALKSTKSSKL